MAKCCVNIALLGGGGGGGVPDAFKSTLLHHLHKMIEHRFNKLMGSATPINQNITSK